ncbi:hypothetical protein CPT_Machias_136 [Staphylococcus phage Machias]|nr:hypothetical protein CPT_Machias_136 [Staphylococcus phage Machias]
MNKKRLLISTLMTIAIALPLNVFFEHLRTRYQQDDIDTVDTEKELFL